ncbi:MAG: hypothetical protein AAGG81_04485 [Chlamydiota bacterium]
MQKKDFIKLAVMGLSSGLLVTNQLNTPLSAAQHETESNGCGSKNGCGGNNGSSGKDESYGKENGNIGFHILSEDELLLELNAKGEKLYLNLSDEGKELARKVASQRCNWTNECKGLNACQTENNACAGQAACKGQGKCAFSDKNLAVKVVSEKMAEKRKQAN